MFGDQWFPDVCFYDAHKDCHYTELIVIMQIKGFVFCENPFTFLPFGTAKKKWHNDSETKEATLFTSKVVNTS